MVAPDVVITTDVAAVALHAKERPATLLAPDATVGVTDGAKKPEGYVRVMVPPGGRDATGVKPRVTVTEDLPVIRSDDAMMNDTDVTCVKDTVGACVACWLRISASLRARS